ncbi:MAG: hypothetical protein ACLF0P_01120 [Thermoanaerobaculia bacterium]
MAGVCLLVGVLAWHVRRELRPTPRSVVVSVRPAGIAVPSHRYRRVVRPPQGKRVVLRLDLTGATNAERYTAEVYPPGSREPAGTSRVLPRRETVELDLGPAPVRGPYRIVVYGLDGRRSRPVATYRVRLGEPELDL